MARVFSYVRHSRGSDLGPSPRARGATRSAAPYAVFSSPEARPDPAIDEIFDLARQARIPYDLRDKVSSIASPVPVTRAW